MATGKDDLREVLIERIQALQREIEAHIGRSVQGQSRDDSTWAETVEDLNRLAYINNAGGSGSRREAGRLIEKITRNVERRFV